MATVALGEDFLESFACLPKSEQKKTGEFIQKFRNNPCASGINYEKLKTKDGRLWSVRIDQTYRGIVLRDDATDIYILLWVDHHDEAYEWAERKRVAINATTGALQVYETIAEAPIEEASTVPAEKALAEMAQPVTADAPATSSASEEKRQSALPFAALSDAELLELGVPQELLGFVRRLTTASFRLVAKSLPSDAYENLSWIVEGFPLSEVLDMLRAERAEAASVADPNDLGAALRNPETLRAFTVVEGEDELQRMLDAPLEKWRVFLHPSQRKIVERNYHGPARVSGGAGTGKTVVAMHRAKRLAENMQPGEKLLFTTFNKTLAEDIEASLAGICSPEVLRHIEVVHLDAWAVRYAKAQGLDFRVAYEEKELKDLWKQAIDAADVSLSFNPDFYIEEWSQVIAAQDIGSFDEYAHAQRKGRGMRLSRRERVGVWKVCEQYRQLMESKRLRDGDSLLNECCKLVSTQSDAPAYAHIIVDEAQDLSAPAYRLLRALAGPEHDNDIFIVGDTQQRIYGTTVVLSRCGINVRGRSSILHINYRTTEEIRSTALGVLSGISFDDLDGGAETDRRTQSLFHGAPPLVKACASSEEEQAFVVDTVHELMSQGVELKDICVIGRSNKLLDDFAEALNDADLPIFRLRNNRSDNRTRDGVRVATMHRAKGLEFGYVLIPGLTRSGFPPYWLRKEAQEEGTEEQLLVQERSLLYVAMTRAKFGVYLSYTGKPSELLP